MPALTETTLPIRATMTIGAVMARYPETYHVFHRRRMDDPRDAGCTLEAAAATHGRQLGTLITALHGAVRAARHCPVEAEAAARAPGGGGGRCA